MFGFFRIISVSILIFYLHSCITTFGQTVAGQYYKNIQFEKIDAKYKLSLGTVESVIQDKYGFIWIGTKDGLFRYDGYIFKAYRNNIKDPTSLSNNVITCLFIDSKGNIWVGTLEGLNLYNFEKDNFTIYQKKNTSNSLSDNFINSITEHANKIWITTNYGGISIFDPQTKTFEQIRYNEEFESGLSTDNLFTMFFDNNSKLWIGTRGEGLDVFDLKNKKWKSYKNDPNKYNSLPNNEIRCIFKDINNNIWLGTHGGGLARYNPDNDNFIVYKNDPNNYKTIGSNVIYNIYEDSYYNLWFCTQDGGLSLYIKKEDCFYNYRYNSLNPKSISTDIIRTIFEDNAGNLWIGTFNEGINFVDRHRKRFNIIENNPFNKNSLSYNKILAIHRDKNKILWIGTDGDGLNRFDPQTNTFTVLRNNKDDINSLSNNKPICIDEDENGNLWIGNYDGGLNFLDTRTLKVKRYFTEKTKGDIRYSVWSVLTDGNKVWIGTNKGLYVLNQTTNTIKSYKYNIQDHKGTNNEDIWRIYKDSKNRILLGTSLGLNVLYPSTGYFEYYEHYENDPKSISKNWVTCITEDAKGRIWIGTNGGGLNYWDEKNNQFINFNTSDNLNNDAIYGILPDFKNNLWISSNNGLMKFNYESKRIHNYDINDGLPTNQFNIVSYYKDIDGNLYFGSNKGVITFFPDSIFSNNYIPPVVFTDFKLFNQSVRLNEPKSPLKKNIALTDKIQLNYSQSVFSISFSALNYSSSERNTYIYMLDGFDNNWIDAGTQHTVTYTNLNPGEYTFKVMGANNDDVWNEKVTSVTIVIKPPFYRTWWFIALAVIAILSSAVSYYLMRMNNIKKQKILLEAEVHKRTLELEERNEEINQQKEELIQQRDLATQQRDQISQQNIELEMHRNNLEGLIKQRTSDLLAAKLKAEESDRLKSAFLANMSHEIRTPMNAIVGFIELLDEEGFTQDEKKHFMSLILNSSQTLMRLIDDIIDFSRIEAGELKIQKVKININDIFRELKPIYIEKIRREKKNIQIICDYTENEVRYIYSDPLRLKQILINLLDNALKFTREGHIKFGYYLKDNQLICYVEDTGIGIEKSYIERIFDRFYKIEEDKKHFYSGTGLGLAISKKLAEYLDGEIYVKSEIEKGSTFYVSFLYFDKKSEIVPEYRKSEINNYSFKWNDKCLLIAEDEESNYLYINKALKNTGIKIEWAKNGIEAVEIVKSQNNIDLILMDIKMPEMNGHEAIKIIKSINPQIPVIAQTAHALQEDKELCLQNGFDEYISKPIEKEKLLSVIKRYLK